MSTMPGIVYRSSVRGEVPPRTLHERGPGVGEGMFSSEVGSGRYVSERGRDTGRGPGPSIPFRSKTPTLEVETGEEDTQGSRRVSEV